MKGRPHFVESADPLPPGRDYIALCGAQIVQAYFTFRWDVLYMGKIIVREEQVCHKCIHAIACRISPGKKYLYGAINSSEVKQTGDDV